MRGITGLDEEGDGPGSPAYQTLADKWKPEDFRDTYTEVLRKAIEGKEFELPAEERPRPVANLMKALEESLARKAPAKATRRSS
jgi:non-homologous end joining protein Ku